MTTVIIGGGIIGTSIAYHLSNSTSASKEADVHVIDSSSQLYSGASGYAGGFLARDWFEPAVAELGALSFDLHRQLAEEHDGARKWGFMQGTAWSLDGDMPERRRKMAEATSRKEDTATNEGPAWLTAGPVEAISDEGVAQVDPLRLCHFLHETTVSRGVKWHHPAQPIGIISDPTTQLIRSVKVLNSETQTEYSIACRNVVICAGPWTGSVYKNLFPSATVRPPVVSALAGYSLVLRSPRYTLEQEQDRYHGKSHAIFATEDSQGGFSPEMFSRQGAEIYIAGLNDSKLALPTRAEGSKAMIDREKLFSLKKTAVRFMGKSAYGLNPNDNNEDDDDDLEVLREGLCFRPISATGRPIISRVKDEYLGGRIKSDHSAVGRDIGGVFVATGHGPWGISHSLGTGQVVADQVDGVDPAADITNPMDEDGYNDSNRAFLQAFMARSTMTFDEAKPVLAAIFSAHEGREVLQEDISQADLNSYIAAANSAISPFDLEIRSVKRQTTLNSDGQSASPFVYALVNTTSDPLTQLATTYTPDEIAFVKRLLDAMFETYNTRRCEALVVSSMQALQLAKVPADANRRESTAVLANGNTTTQGGAAQSLSMTQAETMMSSLVGEGWLEKSAKGYYGLSPRGLMELRGWLVDTYNDEDEEGHRARRVKFCAACKDILTVGQRCADRDCPGRLHDMCVRNFFRLQQSERCPVCKIEWPGDRFVGERAIANTQQTAQARRRMIDMGNNEGSGDES